MHKRTIPTLVIAIGIFACANPLPSILSFLTTATPTPSNTPTPTHTYTPTYTFTPTFTITFTSTFTPSATPTDTSTPTLPPTNTSRPYIPPAPTTGGGGGTGGCPSTNDRYVSGVISLVNGERVANGLPPLNTNWTLVANSQAWSNYMATNNFFAHSGQNVGENIAAGYDSPETVVAGWMDSEGHRTNILNPSYTQVGVGYAYCGGSTYGGYWTLQFIP